MQMNLSTPPALRGDAENQLVQMHSFLFQLTEQLNNALSQADERLMAAERITGLNSDESTGSADPSLADQYQTLKSLIIKTAHTVRHEMDMIETNLASNYIAVSDWGTYEENINRNIVDTAEKTVEKYDYSSRLDSLDDKAAGFDSYMTEAKGSITRGIVDYDEDGAPIIGIAIGQDLKSVTVVIDGVEYQKIDTTDNLALYTSTGITFIQNGVKVAWFKDRKLACNGIDVTDSITLGGKWEINRTNGFSIKWVGGGV